MTSRKVRWLAFLITIAVGVAAGLYYGWVISPVDYVDTTPNTLREDYKADFVLMVAEAYQADGDLEAARQMLALLDEDASAVVEEAFAFGVSHGYASQDLFVLHELLTALQSQPVESET